MKKAILSAVIAGLIVSFANASPFTFVYEGTISNTSISGLSESDPMVISLVLDNGNSSLISQTWNYTAFQSITFTSGSWSASIDYSTGEELDYNTGSFATDGTGTLTSVMNAWEDEYVSNSNVTGTDDPTTVRWYLNGANSIYYSSLGDIALLDVADIRTAANWSVVPEPSEYAAFAGLGMLGLALLRRRKA